MKSNYFRSVAGMVVMAFALILGISSMATVQAQYPYPNDQYRRQQDDRYRNDQYRRDRWNRNRYRDSYPNWGGNEFRQTALNAGYNEGVKAGRNDRNRGRGYGYGYDFRNYSSYQNATKDYNRRFGDIELYRRYFQLAFETGYRDGLNGY
jgi:hypothetical protein